MIPPRSVVLLSATCTVYSPQSGAQCSQHITCQIITAHHSLTFNTVTRNKCRCYCNIVSILRNFYPVYWSVHTGNRSFWFIFVIQRCVPSSYVTYLGWRMAFLRNAHTHTHDRNDFLRLQHFGTSGHTRLRPANHKFFAPNVLLISAAKLRRSLQFTFWHRNYFFKL